MNLKNKLFAGLTALSLVVSSFASIAPIAKADSAEDMAAYTWAFDEGLTTMTSFDAFMFENAINREQAARFLVKGAEALGIELSSDQTCDYKDLASADQSLVEFINEGCELGLFKAQADFNPKQLMTREQAELVVARMVYGMDEVNAYAEDAGISEFAAARELLMADEIVKVEIPAQASVKRGHLLLMLYRLADADVVEPTAPGYAEVSLVSAPADQSVPYNANGVKVGTIKLTAGQNATTVSSVTVTRSGLGNVGDLQGAWLANANTVTDVKSFSTSSQSATIKFSPSLKLAAGESMNFDVMVALNGAVNSEHSFKVSSVNVSNGTASGAPVSLGTIKTTSYKVANVSATLAGQSSLQAGKTNVLVATAKVTPVKEATIKKFVVNKASATPSADFTEAFANMKAYYKGNVVGTVSVTDDKIVVDGLDIAALANETINIELKADITYVGASLTFAAQVGYDSTSIVAVEKNSGYAMPVVNPVSPSNINISGVNLKITKTTTGTTTVNPGASNVTLYEADITSDAEFDVTKFWLKDAQGTFASYTGFSDDKVVLYVGGDDYELTTGAYSATSGFYFQTNGVKFTVEPGQKVKIKVVGSFLSNANAADFKFSFGIDELKSLTDNNTLSISKTQVGDRVSVKNGSAVVKTATVAAPTTQRIYASAEQEIGRFAIKATDDELTLKEVSFANSGVLNGGTLEDLLSDVKLVRLDNTELNSSVEIDGNEIKFTSMSSAFAKDTDVNVKVVANTNTFTNDTLSGTVRLSIVSGSLVATKASDGSNAQVSGTPTFKTYTLGVQAPVVTLVKTDSSRFTVTVKNVDTEADVVLTGIKASVKVDSSNDGYVGKFCLNLQGSSNTDCAAADAASWSGAIGAAGTSYTFVLTTPVTLTKNGGEISYEIYVDSSFINPTGLQALIQNLYFDGTSENYNVSAQ